MAKKEAPLTYLRQFIPEAAVARVLQYLHQYNVHLTITRERKTVLGDYRHATHHQTHRISVNSNLNKFSFLITLIHELAHLVTFNAHGHRVQAHGREWKNFYALLLKDFLQTRIFPEDIEIALQQSIHNLPASSCSDDDLMRVLKKYDTGTDGQIMVEQVEEGKLFDMGEGRVFKKGKKLRKRYQCLELHSGKIYLFSPVFEVKMIK